MRTLDDVISEIENLRLADNNKSMDLWENYEKLGMAGNAEEVCDAE